MRNLALIIAVSFIYDILWLLIGETGDNLSQYMSILSLIFRVSLIEIFDTVY